MTTCPITKQMARHSFARIGILLWSVGTIGAGTATPVMAASGAFSQGSLGFSLGVGSGRSGTDSYYNIGLGVSYYLVDGLNVGLYAETRQGIEPDAYKVSPEIGYVFDVRAAAKPYVGAFFRRTFVDGFTDFDAYGARAGVYLQAGRNAYLGIGVVQEELSDCNGSIAGIPCSDSYGEISLMFHF